MRDAVCPRSAVVCACARMHGHALARAAHTPAPAQFPRFIWQHQHFCNTHMCECMLMHVQDCSRCCPMWLCCGSWGWEWTCGTSKVSLSSCTHSRTHSLTHAGTINPSINHSNKPSLTPSPNTGRFESEKERSEALSTPRHRAPNHRSQGHLRPLYKTFGEAWKWRKCEWEKGGIKEKEVRK